jgi:hypothetical protein
MCSGDVLHTLRGKYIINKLGESRNTNHHALDSRMRMI